MPHSWDPASVALSLVAVTGLAGCVVGPNEEACPSYAYTSIHYAHVLPPERLQPAFEGEGWTWVDEGGRMARLVPPRAMATAVEGVVSEDPGSSSAQPGAGLGTLISFEQDDDLPEGDTNVGDVARAASAIVNRTIEPTPEIDRWITGEQSPGNC